MKFSPEVRLRCDGEALIERALVELDTGRALAALGTMERRLALSRDMARHPTYRLAYGRALLANGRAAESIEPLRQHYERWQSLRPESPYTAEALYWLGRASEVAGEARGRAMAAEAKPALAASPVPSHRCLAVANE